MGEKKKFEEFTGLYSLSKTLRFELKPVGKTMENIKKESWILKRDEQRAKDYTKIKPIFDKLHDDFIQESLSDAKIDWQDFYDFYVLYKSKIRNKSSLSSKDLKQIEDEFVSRQKRLRKDIVELYKKTADEWKSKYVNKKGKSILKWKWFKILTEKNILKVLEEIYKDHTEKLKVIKNFDWFFTYFTGFNQNRENYYDDGKKSTAVAYRIVNQNLITFCNNVWLEDKIEEIGLSEEEKQIFEPNFYNKCLHQQGIDAYNELIGGKKDEKGVRLTDGINQRLNQYGQRNKKKMPKLKPLYKQIGSIKAKTIPFDLIETDEDLKSEIVKFVDLSKEYNPKIRKLIESIFKGEYELNKIWIAKNQLTWISNIFFTSWFTINEVGVQQKIFTKSKKKDGEEKITIPAYVSLAQLKSILESIEYVDQSNIEENQRTYLFKPHYEIQRWELTNNWEFFINRLQAYFTELYDLPIDKLNSIVEEFDKSKDEHKKVLKNYADNTLNIFRFFRLFKVDQGKWNGELADFYADFEQIIAEYPIHKLYDTIRNYITKKPYSTDKIKLNFDCSTLLGGWDKNKETQNLSVLLKDDENYYLAIMRKDNNKFFDKNKNPSLYDIAWNSNILQKMNYKQIATPTGVWWFVRKCFKSAQKLGWQCPVECLTLDGKIIIKDDEINDLSTLIDCYKDFFEKYEKDWFKYKDYDFNFKDSDKYEKLSEFFSDVEKQWYKLWWDKVNKSYLWNMAENGDVYLFQISSKDFQRKNKKSKPDLQTIYWKNMFVDWSNIKLNGQAEIFFRKKSMKKKNKIITKEKQQEIIALDRNNKKYNPWEKQRYTEDKILFHCPITLNFGVKWNPRINDKVNEYIKKNNDIHIIGIDRGEKHLAFYSVVDGGGKIVEQWTLNIINGVNYEKILTEKAWDRLKSRQNWDTIGKIKDLKQGYISQVVRKIVDLVLKYNAIVVLESLNAGFKNSRKKIEQSAYQNLELALAKKLSFLVNKNTKLWEPSSATNAYQLCPAVNYFGDIEKATQYGVMYYARANYTSITDPVSGFRKNLYLKKGKISDMREQILKFQEIWFDSVKNAYYFKYNPWEFTNFRWYAKNWTIWSDVERWRGRRDNHGVWKSVKYSPTEELDKLLRKYDIVKNNLILAQIENNNSLPASFYQSLIWIIDLILQLRNSGEIYHDFILSPVEVDGKKFDSREYYDKKPTEESSNIPMPTSGDANGAYNIARKGLMIVNNIRNGVMSDRNKNFYKLYISDADWDRYVQK